MSQDGPGGIAPALRIVTGPWSAMQPDAAPLRVAVFVHEQGFDEALEWDEHDPVSVHAVAWLDEQAVATGRLLPDGRIGRMAVLGPWRRTGVGGRVLATLVELARARGDAEVELSAQMHAIGFYARHGFEAFGPVYDDGGVPHRSMRRGLRQE